VAGFEGDEEAALISNATRLRRTAPSMRRASLAALILAAAAILCVGQSEPLAAAPVLRVCADPDNMPFSNERGEGFENKLAALIAERLGQKLEYTWFTENSGYVPNTVGEGACDLVMGYAQGTGLIEDTNPYYYTSYVLITRENDPVLEGVDTLSDSRLRGRRIGLFARTPPASILAMRGLVSNAKPVEVNSGESRSKAAKAMIGEVASGKLDAALLWGPIGGYHAARAKVPLRVVPLVNESAGPSTIYPITMGIRPNEPQWKHQINKVLADSQQEINTILRDYNVPVLNQKGERIAAGTALH
jgi:mxaJ protein